MIAAAQKIRDYIDDFFDLSEELPDPIETGEEIICRLQDAIDLIQSVVDDLRNLQNTAE